MHRAFAAALAIAPAIAILTAAPHAAPAGQQSQSGGRWRTAWATSQQGAAAAPIGDTTLRLIARVTIGGDAVRIRIDNSYGKGPLRIGAARIGVRTRGAAVAPGSSRPVQFGGATEVTIAAGGTVRSDPVPLPVLARQDLAVSLYVAGGGALPSQHAGALTTSYVAAPQAGDATAVDSAEPFTQTITTMPWLKAIDVRSASSDGSIVAFGDSITDGTCATVDAHDRWADWLAVRLALEDERRGATGRYKAVVNEGIGGNTVTREGLQPPPDSTPGLERLDRDVLTHEGVTDVVLFMGTNDIRRGASAAQVTAGLADLAARVRKRGIRVFGATIIPRHNVAPTATNSGWNDAKTAIRREVNEWMRSRAGFDGVLDFDRVVRDPASPDRIHAPFDCDGIHPTPRGYYAMGTSIRLDLFAR